jgi:Spy/CpxP family protein refolding chaperone
MKIRLCVLATLVWTIAGATTALSQPMGPCGPGPGGAPHAGGPPCRDPIGENLFPPDVIMAHASEIGLTNVQRTSIESDMRSADQSFRSLQPQMQSATDGLARQLRASRVDQAQVMAQLDKVLGIERSIKHAQLGLMIQIKNVLTADQQAHLRRLMPPPPPMPRP